MGSPHILPRNRALRAPSHVDVNSSSHTNVLILILLGVQTTAHVGMLSATAAFESKTCGCSTQMNEDIPTVVAVLIPIIVL